VFEKPEVNLGTFTNIGANRRANQMRKHVSNSFLRRYPRLSISLLVSILLAVGATTAVYCTSYLTVLWRIGICKWQAPHPNYILVGCSGITPTDYYITARFFDIDPRLTEPLRAADVVVTGSSTAVATFVLKPTDNQIDDYFKNKGLKYYILAQDGSSGFRFRKLLAERLAINPKITLMSTGDLEADYYRYSTAYVYDPDRYKTPVRVAYWAIRLQAAICSRTQHTGAAQFGGWLFAALDAQYCQGYAEATWLNSENGLLLLPFKRLPTNRVQLGANDHSDLGQIEMYWNRASNILRTPSWKQSCVILYDIPAPHGNYKMAREVAKRAGLPFVFPPVSLEKDYWAYDASHMEIDTASRWTKEFLPLLDPQIDACLKARS
jgi:hypothetical protein